MADSDSATPSASSSAPKMTAAQDRDDRALRGNQEAWKSKITPNASEQIPDATRDIPSATQSLPNASQYIDDAMSSQINGGSETNSTDNSNRQSNSQSGSRDLGMVSRLLGSTGKTNSNGRSTHSTVNKSKSDINSILTGGQVTTPTKTKSNAFEL